MKFLRRGKRASGSGSRGGRSRLQGRGFVGGCDEPDRARWERNRSRPRFLKTCLSDLQGGDFQVVRICFFISHGHGRVVGGQHVARGLAVMYKGKRSSRAGQAPREKLAGGSPSNGLHAGRLPERGWPGSRIPRREAANGVRFTRIAVIETRAGGEAGLAKGPCGRGGGGRLMPGLPGICGNCPPLRPGPFSPFQPAGPLPCFAGRPLLDRGGPLALSALQVIEPSGHQRRAGPAVEGRGKHGRGRPKDRSTARNRPPHHSRAQGNP